MAKGYISNRQQNLKIGISSYTESQTVLEVTGKVGIGTTNATAGLDANSVRIRGALYDANNQVGTASSVLTSTASGTVWKPVAEVALQGIQGSQGTQGTIGSQGTQGTIGSQGTQGTIGSQGTQGTTGPVAGSANQVVYKDGSNNPTGSSNLTFDGTSLYVNQITGPATLVIDPTTIGYWSSKN
jgi:hypothetical protein